MRAQMELLEYLIRAWDVKAQSFRLGSHMLNIHVEDIYFLTGLSRRGVLILLSCSRRGGDTVMDSIAILYRPRSQATKYGKIKIKDVVCFPLRTIIFTISRLASCATLHLVNRSKMKYTLECIEPTMFNWSEAVLEYDSITPSTTYFT